MSVVFIGPSVAEQRHSDAERLVAAAMGSINAGTAALCDAIAGVLEHETWQVSGIVSPAHWVTWRAGVSAERAKRLVAIASRKADLPVCWGLFVSGAVGEDAMGVIARKAPPERDVEIAGFATEMLHGQLANVLGHLPDRTKAPAGVDREPVRSVSSFTDENGWGHGKWSLPPDEAAIVALALTRQRDVLFEDRPETPVDWADALVALGETGLDALDPEVRAGRPRGSRHQVIVHVDERSDGLGHAHLHLGPSLSDSVRRYVTCDAKVRYQIEDQGRRLLGITPSAETVDTKTRCYIEDRDRGCRFPGCTARRWLHVHHIQHREDGGLTVVCNLVALCPYHHRLHHMGGYTIAGDPEDPTGLVFTNQAGTTIRPPDLKRTGELPHAGAAGHFTPPSGERLQSRWFTWN